MSDKCKCGRAHDDWPSNDGKGLICQDCWERQCDAEWWDAVTPLIPLMATPQGSE